MKALSMHPIMEQSFAIIDQQIGEHQFNRAEYAIVRRVIHSTADFEFTQLLRFSENAIASGISALSQGTPIVTDVGMVKQGIASMVAKTFGNPLIVAVDQAPVALPGKTRTETGLLRCFEQFPGAIFVIGNAPTALLALCEQLSNSEIKPALVIGATVGFVSVLESKAALAKISIPQIRVEGAKGGSPVAAAILNGLMVLAWQSEE
ncbi:cobalt-precorrin-8X methylmutase [Moorena producens JHB]|uniref:Cobalt-precorrin-8X methylmutase n=1 Tax=Moorena producens (strain JHB) TaxID=1454205 RepID=A0A1D9FYP8_MOOP1|nr:cobalt-precorrin-8X methylmutase [Moorena producens]AOY80451.1 cobalt-precorrin-8X methylmutase [Moorena producens JHB]